jgi:hypothetical protein
VSDAYQDLANLFGVYDGSAQTPINTLDKMFDMSGNPMFLYLTGVIDESQFGSFVRSALVEPVDISGADYFVMQDMNAGDPVLSEAYRLIQRGVSVNAAMIAMLKKYNETYANDVDMLDSRSTYMEYALADLNEFKAKWDKAQEIASKRDSGEYMENPDGTLSKKMDPTKGSDVLKQLGLPPALQNTLVWDVVPDDKLLAIAASKDEYAMRILKPFASMIDPATGVLVQKEAKKIAQEATSKAKSAYEVMLNRTPEGREYLKQVTTGKTQAEKSQDARGAILRGPLTNIPGIARGIQAVGNNIVDQIKEGKVQPSIAQIVGGKIAGLFGFGDDEKKEKANQADVDAKLAASYAGRAEQERLRKPLDSARTLAANAMLEAQQYRQASVSPYRGTTPAVSWLNQAFPFASLLSQTGERQMNVPSPMGTRATPGIFSVPNALSAAKTDPRLKGLTPQQVDLFSTFFAKSFSSFNGR